MKISIEKQFQFIPNRWKLNLTPARRMYKTVTAKKNEMKAKKGNLFTSNIHEELGICHSSFNPAQFCPIQAIKSKIKPISFFSGEFVRTLMNIVIKKKEKVTSNQVD